MRLPTGEGRGGRPSVVKRNKQTTKWRRLSKSARPNRAPKRSPDAQKRKRAPSKSRGRWPKEKVPNDALSVPRRDGDDDQIISSSFSLHDLFQQQAMKMLDRADIGEEE